MNIWLKWSANHANILLIKKLWGQKAYDPTGLGLVDGRHLAINEAWSIIIIIIVLKDVISF